MEMITFCDRLRQRLDVWWAQPGGWRNPSAWHRPLHRVVDTHRLRSRAWPLQRWKCCDAWQRCLTNKWNAREFAAMHDVPVPQIYWCGRNLLRLPYHALPGRFAVRRAWGAGTCQTHLYVDGRELLDDRPCTPRQLQRDLLRQYGPWTKHPLLIEEFVEPAEGEARAVEFNFYCFGGFVGLVEHFEPAGRTSNRCAYDTAWRPYPEVVYSGRPRARPIARPPQLDAMLAVASRLGAAYGTFVRVDLYLSRDGIRFGEFSSTPFRGSEILPWADALLGRMWAERCPTAL